MVKEIEHTIPVEVKQDAIYFEEYRLCLPLHEHGDV